MIWSDIDTELGLLLKDPTSQSYSSEFRIAMFNRAQQFFAETHTAPLTAVSHTATASGTLVTLPANMIQLAGVLADSEWLIANTIGPGYSYQDTGYLDMGNAIKLSQDLENGFQVWYWRFYNSIADSSSVVELPGFAHWAVINLTLAYLLNPDMVAQAKLRQFQANRDAGAPEDNPPRRQALYYLEQYREALSFVLPQIRGVFAKR